MLILAGINAIPLSPRACWNALGKAFRKMLYDPFTSALILILMDVRNKPLFIRFPRYMS